MWLPILKILKALPKPVYYVGLAISLIVGVYFYGYHKGRASIPELTLPPETTHEGEVFIDTTKWISEIEKLKALLARKPSPLILPVEDSNCQKYVTRLEQDFASYQDSLKPFLGLVELALSYPDSLKDEYLEIPGWKLKVTVFPKKESGRFRYNAQKASLPGDSRYKVSRENFLAISPGLGYDFDSGSIAGRLELELKSWSLELIKSGFQEWRTGWSGFLNKKIFSL